MQDIEVKFNVKLKMVDNARDYRVNIGHLPHCSYKAMRPDKIEALASAESCDFCKEVITAAKILNCLVLAQIEDTEHWHRYHAVALLKNKEVEE